MKTLANVYLLPTKDITNIALYSESTSYNKPLLQLLKHNIGSSDYKYQHLYITLPQSDLEISKTDNSWCLDLDTMGIYLKVGDYISERCEKIIATTDSSLNLPSIPQSFIEYFISEYNQGNIIKAEVELNQWSVFSGDKFNVPITYTLKLNHQNEISIVIPETTHIIHQFVKEIQEEFKDDVNLDYLTFAADRFINKLTK